MPARSRKSWRGIACAGERVRDRASNARPGIASGRDGSHRITDFIALDNPERADQFEDELLERAQKISLTPLGYAERCEFREGLRSCAHGAYVIFFTVDEQGVRIERILHGARDLGSLLNQ